MTRLRRGFGVESGRLGSEPDRRFSTFSGQAAARGRFGVCFARIALRENGSKRAAAGERKKRRRAARFFRLTLLVEREKRSEVIDQKRRLAEAPVRLSIMSMSGSRSSPRRVFDRTGV
jgi:hypothetical protein